MKIKQEKFIFCGIAIVVENNGLLLLVEEAEENKFYGKEMNSYGFPSGKVELGESIIEAAVRECREETGYDIKIINIISLYLIRGGIGIAFRGKLKQKISENIDEDINNAKWLPPEDIYKLKLRPAVEKILDDWQAGVAYPLNLIRDVR